MLPLCCQFLSLHPEGGQRLQNVEFTEALNRKLMKTPMELDMNYQFSIRFVFPVVKVAIEFVVSTLDRNINK